MCEVIIPVHDLDMIKCIIYCSLQANAEVLFSTEREKDVGVIVSSDMKVSEQNGIAARQGNQKDYNITDQDKRLTKPLYKSLLRTHLLLPGLEVLHDKI